MDAPSIDIAIAVRFLDCLGEDQTFTFQTFADKKIEAHSALASGYKPPSLIKVLHGTFEQHASMLAHLNQNGAGIFVTINATDGTGRKAENIIRVRALFLDLDGAPIDPVLAHIIPPNIVVESSPHKFHAYWRTDDCPLDDFKPAQQRLAYQFNGDPKVCDLPRVMRLPGFIHQKAEPFMTRIILPS